MNILKNSILLTAIMLLAVLSLSFAHDLTQPVIEDQKEQQFYNQVHLIFDKAQRTALKPYYEDGVLVDEYYVIFDRFDQRIGYVVLEDVQGYQSEIKLLVALDRDKEIKEIRILQQEETPGIGSKVTEKSFLDQFKNKEEVDTITGATISSKAVIKGVSEALENVE
ncbi:MAG: FMN-binding protein [Candidatus Woesearchaeota archaeon]